MRFPEQYWNKKHEDRFQKGLIDAENKPLSEVLRRKFLIDKAKAKKKDEARQAEVDNFDVKGHLERQKELDRQERIRTTS